MARTLGLSSAALGLWAALATADPAPAWTPAQQQALEVLLRLPQQPDGPRSLWTLALTSEDEWVVALGLRTCQADPHCERVLALRWIQLAPGNFRAWVAAQPHLPFEQSLKGVVGSHYASDFRAQHCAAYQARPAAADGRVPAWPQSYLRVFPARSFRAPRACRAHTAVAPDTRNLCEAAADAAWRWSASDFERHEALAIMLQGGPRRSPPLSLSADWAARRADFEARQRHSSWNPTPWRAEDSPCPHPTHAR